MADGSAVAWCAALAWVACCCVYLHWAPTKMSLRQLALMMPQWCEMTDLSNSRRVVELPPGLAMWTMLAALVLSSLCWFFSIEADMEQMQADVTGAHQEVEARKRKEDETADVVLQAAKGLAQIIDFEFKHCAATIAANNETPGRRVGGEVEWATGETSSEDEDATRVVTGAHIGKCPRTEEDGAIMKYLLDEPFLDQLPDNEPHLRKLPSAAENKSS